MSNDIETAQAAIQRLTNKQQNLVQKTIELSDERSKIAFASHAEGDAKARKRLDQINQEMATMASEHASIESAIEVATERLAAAQRETALAEDRTQAEQLRIVLSRWVELGLTIDDCFIDMNSAAAEMKHLLSTMHQLGAKTPSHEQVRVLGALALKSALQTTPWAKEFETIAPNQRRTFATLVTGWRDQLTPHIMARIGIETKQTDEKAA
jgi:chromosome segregation ATPase